MAQTIMDHIRLGCELGMRPMSQKLRDRKSSLGNVGIESPVRQWALCGHQVHIGLMPQSVTEVSQLWNLCLRDAERPLRLEIDSAGVNVQGVEFGTDLLPNSCLFRRVLDQRRPERFETVPATQRKQFLTPRDVVLVSQSGMPRLELQLRGVRWLYHRLGVDRRSIFNQIAGLFHGGPPS